MRTRRRSAPRTGGGAPPSTGSRAGGACCRAIPQRSCGGPYSTRPGRRTAYGEAMSGANRWTLSDMPDQRGRTAVVTGSNSGIGYEAALALAQHAAAVVLACRDLERAEGAAARIRAAAPGATVSTLELDLASLASVRRAAEQLRGAYDHLDLLINNAGLMFPPYGRTEDGFELQIGTNHLGHFALTGLVLDRLLATPGSRVVTVSSVGHRDGVMRFDDLQFERGYRADDAYGQSKLANLLFTYELAARLQE